MYIQNLVTDDGIRPITPVLRWVLGRNQAKVNEQYYMGGVWCM